MGLRAKSQYDDAREHCRTESFCEPDGLTGIDDARTTATVSTVLFAAGGGLLAVGVILFVSAPKATASRGATQPTVSARLSYGSARLEGTW